ncbi:hypothetical protein [Xanthomonas sp. 1678]|uniref:hypothetical protein n=1 Tax=Xanthomonas sp. 1678 TaxID=3158788 RepID=UPI002866124E|nr:hypothetical protein [Xanthomonas translucens]
MDKNMKSFARFRLLAVLCVLCVSVPSTAFAQWKVRDEKQISENKTNTNTLDKKLDKIRDDNKIGAKSSGEKPSGTEVEKLSDEMKPKKIDANYGIAACGATKGTPVTDGQKTNCELIQKTKNAQFNYMVAMYEITTKRLERLRDLEKERNNIAENEIGKLEDNTNKLIALKTLMDIDRQQMESAMFAYDIRLKYLQAQQSNEAESAMKGKKSNPDGGGLLGDIVGTITDMAQAAVAGAVMKTALEGVKTDKPSDMSRLSYEK